MPPRVLDLFHAEDASAYVDALAGFGSSDPQYSLAFVRSAAMLEPGKLFALSHAEGGESLLYPFVIRDLSAIPALAGVGGSWRDSTTPFEYGGILTSSPAAWPALEADFMAALDRFFAEQSVVSEFIRFNPFLPLLEGISAHYEIRPANDSVYIDTSRPKEVVVAEADRSVRKNLRRAQDECGLTFSQVIPDSRTISQFERLYRSTMERTGARKFYFFPSQYFHFLLANSAHVSMFHVRAADGAVVASSILVHGDGIAHHFLTGSDGSALAKRPNDFMLIGLADWCFQNGYTKLHLGSGPPSVRSYKQRFSNLSAAYFVGHRIIEAGAYADLTRHRFGIQVRPQFLPAYREGL